MWCITRRDMAWRVADHRLRQAQVLGHLGYALLDHQLLEHHQLVEVDIGQFHGGSSAVMSHHVQ
jgi:hypothetical protein